MTTPQPPIAAEVDLRDFAFMPLDLIRLFGSRFHAIANDSEWRAGVTLWCKSFHQVPAASLPNDDVELCRLAELGRDLKAWKRLREVALHGWVLCDDGRLYHPVVAEKANEAWSRKQAQRERSRRGNAARWGARGDPGDESGGGQGPRTSPPDRSGPVAKGSPKDPVAIPNGSPEESSKDPKGQGQGQGQGESSLRSPRAPAPTGDPGRHPPNGDASVEPSAATLLAVEARRLGVACNGADPRIRTLAEQGTTAETLRAAIEHGRAKKGAALDIGYVAGTLAGWARDAAGLRVVGAAPPGARGGVTDEQLAELQARLEAEDRDAAA